ALAELSLAKRDFKNAEKSIGSALLLSPTNAEALRVNGEILRSEGDLAGALSSFTEILNDHPNNVPALLSRATVLVAQKKMTDAQRDVDQARKIAPGAIGGLYLDAFLKARRGEFKDADIEL